MKVYSNTSSKNIVRNGFYNNLKDCLEVFIASPFFSYSDLVEDVLKSGAFVKLIVRLGPATSADSLKRIIHHPNIHIRFFTTPKFHSKLYIFAEKAAIVGSANLTAAGMQSNSEICVEIPSDNVCFDDLVKLYQSYWGDAEPLTPELLGTYSTLSSGKPVSSDLKYENDIQNKFGKVEPTSGIEVGKKGPSKEKVFLSSYSRTYQEFRTAFDEVQRIYLDDGRRQQPEELVPLRIEIDLFFSYVRQTFSKGESYLDEPLRSGNDRIAFVKARLNDWFSQRWAYLDEHIPAHLPRINDRLSSKLAIDNSTYDELLDALDVCHSFHDRLRFFLGGQGTHVQVFRASNELARLKKVLSYLLHGKDDYITRMANCIFDPQYELNQFGRSVVQELLGWVNKEGIPICNSRTVKALRYLGYDVTIFSK